MPKHPSDGALRRLLDEPCAVAVDHDYHSRRCPRCQGRMATMRHDDQVVGAALPGRPDAMPAALALEQLRTAQRSRRGSAVAHPWRRPAITLNARPAAGHRLVRPATALAAALVVTGGATAAAATHLLPIFQPEQVAPIVVQTSDLSNLADLSRFGTVTGSGHLALTPESSAAAMGVAAGFELPALNVPASVATGSPSYWLISPDYAQVQISAAKAAEVALKAGATPVPAPAGVDGAVLRVDTGPGALEAWGTIGQPSGSFASRGAGSALGIVRHGSQSAPGASPRAGAGPARAVTGPSLPGAADTPQLAVVEVKGPIVSSSGASLATLEQYLLAQPGISAQLAAEIRAIGDPASTLPVPVPASGTSSTVNLAGHPAVVQSLGSTGNLVVWAANGRIFAVFGSASADQLVQVAAQLA